MKKYRFFLSIAVFLSLQLVMANAAKSNTIINGDFSTGSLAGWETSGNVIVTDYLNIPAAAANIWDLNVWNGKMDGSFALIDNYADLTATVSLIPGSIPTSLSFDYGVAWSNPRDLNSHGYSVVQTYGIKADGSRHWLSYGEIDWGAFNFDPSVLAGTYSTNKFRDLGLDYTGIAFNVFSVSLGLNQIIGIDNVDLSVAAPVAPVPEPSVILLLSFGVTGSVLIGRRLRKN